MPPTSAPLRFTSFVATLWVLVAAGYTVYTVVIDLVGYTVPVSLSVAPFWPKVNPTMQIDGATGSVTGGGYDHAFFDISGLSMDARVWLAAAALVLGIVSCSLGVAVALLCRRVGAGAPFDELVPRAFTVSGMIVLVGGLAWQILDQLAGYRVIDDTFRTSAANWLVTAKGHTINSVTWPATSGDFTVSFWPIAAALGLFAIAVVFRYGANLAKDKAKLEQDVEGLV